MFERIKGFFRGVGQLIRNPNALEHYQSALAVTERYREEAVQHTDRLQAAYAQVHSELNFRKEMDATGIAVGRSYVDTELGPELLLDRPQEADRQKAAVSVSYVKVTGFSVEDGSKFIETNLGKIRAERFLDRTEQGKLVTMEQARAEVEQGLPSQALTQQHVPGYAELAQRMRDAGFVHVNVQNGNDFILWDDMKTGKRFGLGDWDGVRDFLDNLEQGKVAALLIYPSTEMEAFTDPGRFLEKYREEMDACGPTGVSARLVSGDPALRKATDDLIYDQFGEENPHDLDYYRQTRVQAETQAVEMEL